MIDASTEGAAVQPSDAETTQGADVSENETDTSTDTEGQETEATAQPAAPAKEEIWPTKAVNALGKAKAKAVRAQTERDYYKRMYEQSQAGAQPQNQQGNRSAAPEGPKPQEYDDPIEYQRAVARHEALSVAKEQDKQRTEDNRKAQYEGWTQERGAHVNERAQEARKSFPEFDTVLTEHADVVDALPPEIKHVFLEANNGPLGFFVLAQEGKLDELFDMSPTLAAATLARAEDRGAAQLKARTKTVTQAPEPMTPNKGGKPAAASNIPLATNDRDKILSWVTGKKR